MIFKWISLVFSPPEFHVNNHRSHDWNSNEFRMTLAHAKHNQIPFEFSDVIWHEFKWLLNVIFTSGSQLRTIWITKFYIRLLTVGMSNRPERFYFPTHKISNLFIPSIWQWVMVAICLIFEGKITIDFHLKVT